MDRASTFADSKVLDKLKTQFVCVAGNVGKLAWNRTAEAKWFVQMATQVNYKMRSADSTQGFYVAGADGKGYAFTNVRGAPSVLKVLDQGLTAFAATPPVKVQIVPQNKSIFAGAPSLPLSVVRVYTRVWPLPLGANSINKSIGRDHLWITAADVSRILAATKGSESFPMPPQLAGRMLRFHLVDNVRGQPDMWLPEEVRKGDLKMQLLSAPGTLRIYAIKGTFAMSGTARKHGFEGSVYGECVLDSKSKLVQTFRLYADGYAWGDSKFTGHAPVGKFPLVVAMVEASDELTRSVAPEAFSQGADYFSAPANCLR